MKAIDLINAMCYENEIAENGATMIPDGRSLSDYFGTSKPFEGNIVQNGIYFYLYIVQGHEPYFYHLLGMPDAVSVRDEEMDIVALWRIE